jgi:hypothetical protein
MPLPAIEDVFQKMGDSARFCVMDITKIHRVYPSEYWAF